MTFAEDIEKAAAGDPIEHAVIGPYGSSESLDDTDGFYEPSTAQTIPRDRLGVVLSWDEARPLLDYDYDAGFGGVDCHAIVAWTSDRVLFVVQYDGSTSVCSVARHPVDHTPSIPGV